MLFLHYFIPANGLVITSIGLTSIQFTVSINDYITGIKWFHIITGKCCVAPCNYDMCVCVLLYPTNIYGTWLFVITLFTDILYHPKRSPVYIFSKVIRVYWWQKVFTDPVSGTFIRLWLVNSFVTCHPSDWCWVIINASADDEKIYLSPNMD